MDKCETRRRSCWAKFVGHAVPIGMLLLALIQNAQAALPIGAAGRTPVQYSVSPTGAAIYTIPIWTPPGTRGIQPHLVLTYNSQADSGLLGPGWALSGLSQISRCNATYAQNGMPAAVYLTAADKFCIDGNQLQVLSGSTYGAAESSYQTELADFSRIIGHGAAGNGPAWFEVKQKNGLIYEYGNSNDGGSTNTARVATSGSNTPYAWLLNKIRDRQGNNMVITYSQSNGTAVPVSIQYTQTPASGTTYPYTVSIHYVTRSSVDTKNLVIAGTTIQQTQQITGIDVFSASSGGTIHHYEFSYSTSLTTQRYLLSSVQECGSSAGTACLQPTTITYQRPSPAYATTVTANNPSASTASFVWAGDFNGDGVPDILYQTYNGLYVQFGTYTGLSSPVNTGMNPAYTDPVVVEDFDGDGKTDVLWGRSGVWWRYQVNGTSPFVGASLNINIDPNRHASANVFSSADLNADGLPDLLWMNRDGKIYQQLNTSSGGTISFSAATLTVDMVAAMTTLGVCSSCYDLTQTTWVMGNNSPMFAKSSVKRLDFNGDGRDDFMVALYTPYDSYLVRLVSSPSGGYIAAGYSLVDGSYAIPVKWNDDNCTDLADWLGNISISDCSTGASAYNLAGGTYFGAALDWDGDGRTDLIGIANGNLTYTRSLGGDTATTTQTSIPANWNLYYMLAFDINGDGLYEPGGRDDNGNISFEVHSQHHVYPDLAYVIQDGFGNSYGIDYQTFSVTPGYTHATGATVTNREFLGSLYVVESMSAPDATGNADSVYNHNYTYSGARINVQGRGFEGFESISISDSRNGLLNKRYYKIAFPYTSFIYEDDVYQSNGTTLVSATSSTVAQINTNPGIFPYISAQTGLKYEVGGPKNGQLITTTSQTFTYDAFGNATNVATTVTDNDSTSPYAGLQWSSTTASPVSPDPANWCIGIPTQAVVTNSAPNTATITRTKSFSIDYANCRVTQEVTEPSNATYTVTRAFGFDSIGNVSSVTVTGANMTARSTSIYWGPTGHVPRSVTNALGQTTLFTYDEDHGLVTGVIDPNGISIRSVSYDPFGRPAGSFRPDGTYDVWTYDDCAESGTCPVGSHGLQVVHRVQNTDNSIQTDETIYYDFEDRPLIRTKRMLGGGYDRNEVRYDAAGHVLKRSMPCAWSTVTTSCTYWTTYTYDALDRELSESRPISSSNSTAQATSISYQGRTTVTTDAQGKTTTSVTTAVGTLGRSQDHNGYYQSFTYDAFGNLKSVTDSLSNTLFSASYVYGIDAFQTGTTDMDRGTWGYTPNALGEIVAYTDASGTNTFNMTYDALSRLLTRTASGEGTTYFTYGSSAAAYNIGQLQSISSTNGPTETYTYDNKGRLANRQIAADVTYNYDYTYSGTTGLLDTLTYPTSTSSYRLKLQYAYQNGFMTQIKDYNSSVIFWNANAANSRGQVTQETLGNGLVTNRSYDAVTGWLNYIQCGSGGGTCSQNQSYLYDLVGNLTQRQNNNLGLTENFYYDNLYRLSSSQLNGSTNLSLGYDATGNITSKSDVADGATWTYHSTKKHAVIQAGNSNYTYSYDANGNAITRNGYGIQWNAYNYPTMINGNGESTTLYYDANFARWKQVYTKGAATETTLYIGGLLQKVTNDGGASFDYRYQIKANGQTVALMSRTTAGANNTRYILRDHQGGVAKITNSSGGSVVSESFTAFGARRNPATWSGPPTNGDQNTINSISREGYTGQEVLGSMGLNHMNGRVQDAITGRFLSPDPFVAEPWNTQGFNRYSYVYNNPLTTTDPSGFCNSQDEWSDCTPADVGPSDPAHYEDRGDGALTVVPNDDEEEDSSEMPDPIIDRNGPGCSGCSQWHDVGNPGQSSSGGSSAGSGNNSSTVGVILHGLYNQIPGAQFALQSQMAWQHGNYLNSVILYGDALGEAALGVFTFGEGSAAVSALRSITAASRASAYSVAFETTIAKLGAGTRPEHFRQANQALAAAIEDDAAFAKLMDDLGISIGRYDKSPAGWSWHHVPDQPGVMQLVPRSQHQGGAWQSLLHPGQEGGFALWGADY